MSSRAAAAEDGRLPGKHRCLPPRLLLDGNLKQEHPLTKGIP
jgi:hypothetical protein